MDTTFLLVWAEGDGGSDHQAVSVQLFPYMKIKTFIPFHGFDDAIPLQIARWGREHQMVLVPFHEISKHISMGLYDTGWLVCLFGRRGAAAVSFRHGNQ